MVGLSVLVACNDRLPTLSGEGPFPVGSIATTIELLLTPDEFLDSAHAYGGATGVAEFQSLLAAERYGGELTAHILAKLGTFPDTIDVEGERDGDFIYLNSEVVATVPDTLRAFPATVTLELWTVTQEWDPATATWENAENDSEGVVPWTEPGGTRGELISVATWSRAAAGASGDSLSWAIPSTVVTQLAEEELPGLMVRLAGDDSRIRISPLSLRARIQPSAADTVIERTIQAGEHTFVFTPTPPQPENLLRVGGITSDRTVLRLRLPEELPACPPPQACGMLPADEVSLNRVEVLLDPLPVTAGFDPESTLLLTVRRVLEPDLGERAPLGTPISQDTVSASRFRPGPNQPVRLILTGGVLDALRNDETELAIAIVEEPEAFSFGYAWFDRDPRLRILYTLPDVPQLP